MRRWMLVLALGLIAANANADDKPPTLALVAPREMIAKAPVQGTYAATVTIAGIHATTKLPWTSTVPIRAVSYELQAARPGRNKAGVVKITRDFTSTKEFLQLGPALGRGDKITAVTVTFRSTEQGRTPHTFVLVPIDARVESSTPTTESVAFTYEKITWTWTENGKTREDSWSATEITGAAGRPSNGAPRE